MSPKPVVAVTGANGYVGSIIVEALDDSARVVRLVRNPKGAADVGWAFGAEVSKLARTLQDKGVTHLIHAAWDMQASSQSDLEKTCVAGSAALLEAARLAGVTNIVFISTISAFEGARSAYGRSKLKVEALFRHANGLVLRLGLVYGDPPGGAFAKIDHIAKTAAFVPLIGDGRVPQYLLDKATLGEVARRAVSGDLGEQLQPITVASPDPILFRNLLERIAHAAGRRILLLPVPWRLLYFVLRAAECLGLKVAVRSDSIVSFIYHDAAPDFAPLLRSGISPARFPT